MSRLVQFKGSFGGFAVSSPRIVSAQIKQRLRQYRFLITCICLQVETCTGFLPRPSPVGVYNDVPGNLEQPLGDKRAFLPHL